jgi:hypothetical protein
MTQRTWLIPGSGILQCFLKCLSVQSFLEPVSEALDEIGEDDEIARLKSIARTAPEVSDSG